MTGKATPDAHAVRIDELGPSGTNARGRHVAGGTRRVLHVRGMTLGKFRYQGYALGDEVHAEGERVIVG